MGACKVTDIEILLAQFEEIANNPKKQLEQYISEGKKVIGCYPYYVPEELIYAAGMIPMGLKRGIQQAKEYFAPFYCSLANEFGNGLNGDLQNFQA